MADTFGAILPLAISIAISPVPIIAVIVMVLDEWKAWLGEHNAAVMTVLLVVMGSILLGKGLEVFD